MMARRIPPRCLAILAALVLAAGCTTTVPVTGRRAFTLVGASQINSMGFQQYASFLKQHKLSDDAAATAMVRRSGRRIAAAVEHYLHERDQLHLVDGFEWEFNLIEDKAVNAFCMPGGKVAVYTGILPVTQDENGLAVVVAHEIAHAVAQHSRERMSQALMVSLGGLALNRALKEKGGRTRALFMGLYGAGTSLGYMLPHSRMQEYEADHLGLIFMAMAGYDPRAAVPLWQRMSAQGKGAKPPPFLSTHPTDAQRIAKIRELLPAALRVYRSGGGTASLPAPSPRRAEIPSATEAKETGAAHESKPRTLEDLREENARLRRELGME